MVERLKARRREVREQMAVKPAEPLARQRYTGVEAGAEAGELPVAETQRPYEAPRRKPAEEAEPAETARPAAPTHLDRLLKAKREAKDRMKRDASSP